MGLQKVNSIQKQASSAEKAQLIQIKSNQIKSNWFYAISCNLPDKYNRPVGFYIHNFHESFFVFYLTWLQASCKYSYHICFQLPHSPNWVARGLRHCIAVLEASLHTRGQSRAVSQPSVIGSPIGQHTIGPALSGLGEGLADVGRRCK